MVQQQHAAEVHLDELCPPNKRYDLMDANKKVDLEHVQCPPESKSLTNIIKNHRLRFSIAASSSVPWIYMAQLWHNLKEDGSKYRLRNVILFSSSSPTSSIPYPRFTKIIVSHYMTIFPEISRRARDMYHHLQDDEIMKNIFNSGRHKDKVGMQNPDWMITEEMKHTEHYRIYAEVFVVDVPLTHSQLTESTQGTHRTPSTPRRSTRLTPLVPVPTVEKANEMILQDTLQVSLAKHKSREEQEARENVELVNKHLASEEIEKLVEGSENVIDDSLPPRNDEPQIPGTRIEPRSDKESPEVEKINDEEVEVTNVVIHVNVNEEEHEITDEVYELKRREKGKIVEESRSTPLPTPIMNLLGLIISKPARFKRYKNFFQELQGRYTYLFKHLKERFLSRKSFDTLADHLQKVMVESLPTMVDTHIKEQGENSAKWQKTSKYEAYVFGESSSGQVNEEERGPSNSDQTFCIEVKDVSGPEKIVLLLHKFPTIIFNDDDIEERTSRWVNKCAKKFNPYARYGIKYWKNPQAKIFYIRKQKEPGKPKEEIVARRANECIVSITEPDYKNLNKNDIEDMYLLIMNGKVPDYAETGLLWSLSVFIRSSVIWERVHDFQLGIESYQQKVNLTALIISFLGVEKHKMFSIIYEPVHGIIYNNRKKEKRVMRHSEIHKFCDATLNRVLEGLKSYNNDVKYGYVQKELTNDEVEYLKLFEEEIEVRLKYRNQVGSRWEMYVNGRPLGPRRERPE
ncbi:hypothetical protein Tco_1128926 [Tanacetum coccineum]